MQRRASVLCGGLSQASRRLSNPPITAWLPISFFRHLVHVISDKMPGNHHPRPYPTFYKSSDVNQNVDENVIQSSIYPLQITARCRSPNINIASRAIE